MPTTASARLHAAALVTAMASFTWAQPPADQPAVPSEKVPAIEGPGPVWRLSINAKGYQARGHSRRPTVSDDGRFVTFQSYADNLIAGGHPEYGQYFLRDTTGGELRRLDPPAAEGRAITFEAPVTGDGSAVIMAIGRYDGANETVICRYDIQARTSDTLCRLTRDENDNAQARVSRAASLRSARTATAIPLATEQAEYLRCSRDGRIITFCVQLPGEEPGSRIPTRATGIAVYDARTGEVSLPISNVSQFNSRVQYLLSSDGSTLLFASDEPVGDDDTNSSTDIFAYDLRSAKIDRLSVSSRGIEGDAPSFWPVWISSDGQRAIFRSRAANLADDPNSARYEQDYLRDRAAGTTSIITGSRASLATLRQDRLICYQPGQVQAGQAALVIRDPASKREHEIPLGNNSELPFAFSTDGRWGVFSSPSTSLVPNDTNNRDDVFLIDIDAALPAAPATPTK